MLNIDRSGSLDDSPGLAGATRFILHQAQLSPCLQVNSTFLEPQSGEKRSAADINLSVVCTGHV